MNNRRGAATMGMSKRERQLMDILFELGEASAAEVHQLLPDPPTYTAVRTMLKLLEDKKLILHREQGRKYIYSPCKSPQQEGRSALGRVLQIFFGGSLEDALAAHLSDPKVQPDLAELARLRQLLDDAAATCSENHEGRSR